MITFASNVRYRRITDKLKRLKNLDFVYQTLETNGRLLIEELKNKTPIDTGETKSKWTYRVEKNGYRYVLILSNSELTSERTPIVILIEYGHGTRNGGYVNPLSFIEDTVSKYYKKIYESVFSKVNSGDI